MSKAEPDDTLLSRLAAEGAVEPRSKRKIAVPVMTAERLDEVMRGKLAQYPGWVAPPTRLGSSSYPVG